MLKMTSNQRYFSTLQISLLLFMFSSVNGRDSKYQLNFDTVKRIYSFKQNLNISSVFSEMFMYNSTENYECLNELNAIANGFTNFDRWAIQIADAWGTFPSGTQNGNLFALGSFAQCFHIEQNGIAYKTQYCIGKLKFLPEQPILSNSYWSLFHDKSTISLGMCLPAVCSVDNLEYVLNKVIERKFDDIIVEIPKYFCQFEESPSQFNTIDLYTIGLLVAVLLLIILSTAYDICCTINKRFQFKLFTAFSIYTNCQKLFSFGGNANKNADVIECLRGIRVLSSLHIVYFHTYIFYVMTPLQDTTSVLQFTETYRGKFAFSPVAVDSFFTIGGLLVAKKMFKLFKKNGKLNISSLYLDRFLRLTPLFCVCVLVHSTIFRFFGSGPIWMFMNELISGPCAHHPWSTLLHLQNYINPTEICFMHSWSMSVDMQLYFIAPAIVYLIQRYNAKARTIVLVSVLCSIGLTLASHVIFDLQNLFEFKYIVFAYFFTHIRLTGWIIGFFTGYILTEFPNGSIRIPKIWNLCAITLSLATFVAVILVGCPAHQSCDAFLLGLYNAFGRVVWSMALSYIIFACVHHCCAPINWFLSHPCWELLSKLSFSIYLVHMPVILLTMTFNDAPHFSELATLIKFIGIYVLSICVAIPATLAFEMPIDAIYKSFDRSRNAPITEKTD